MARKKVSTTVYLEPWQIEALKAQAEASGVPMAKAIRDAITDYLNSNMDSRTLAVYRRHDAVTNTAGELEQLRAKLESMEQRLAQTMTLVGAGKEGAKDDDEAE